MAKKKEKDRLLVLVGRHGESWPRHVTRDVSLAARWESGDSAYRSIVEMSVDDDLLLKQVVKEEKKRVGR